MKCFFDDGSIENCRLCRKKCAFIADIFGEVCILRLPDERKP